jgi:predicted HTH transcriptional regulator
VLDDPQTVAQLLLERESETLELKERVSDPRSLSSNIAAMANTLGGRIVIGIREPGRITGVSPREVERLYDHALAHLEPQPCTSLGFVRSGGRVVAIVTVEKSPELVLSSGVALWRVGSALRPMSKEQIMRVLPRTSARDEELVESIAKLSKLVVDLDSKIAKLDDKIARGNTFAAQLPNYLWGGVIGALLGALVTAILQAVVCTTFLM